MHLPMSHLSGYEEDVASEDHLVQAHQLTHSATSNEEAVSHNSQSQETSAKEAKDPSSTATPSSAPTDQPSRPPKDLPCPRCQSMNTKFCYYNNYSVNQPRHFCRNCQRYWTVGGTLRNIPVGGGSRKKSSRSSSRARADPYYRGDGGGSTMTPPNETSTDPSASGSSFSDLMSPFLHQFGLQFPFAMSSDEDAEMMSTAAAAAMALGGGLWMPDLEPPHVALMQKAALWAEAQQRLQTCMARRALWADECKPSAVQLAAPATPPIQRQPAEQDRRPHRRPGFWETALMHSRREPKPERDQTLSHHSIDMIPLETSAPFSQPTESPSWAPGSVNSEMFY